MLLIWALELTSVAMTLAVVLTQIAIPLVRGTPLWPFVRREQGLRTKLRNQQQRKVEDVLARRYRERNEE